MDNLSNKQLKWANVLSFILRGLTMILYLAVFVYALPYGFGMLKRLNLALQQSSGISFKEKSKSSRRKVDNKINRSFIVLRRFIMLMTFTCIIFWLTHLFILVLKQGHQNMEYCAPHFYVYVKIPEKILECFMVACLILTLSNRNKAKRAASQYSRKQKEKNKRKNNSKRLSSNDGRVRTTFSSLYGERVGSGFVSDYNTYLTSEDVSNVELVENVDVNIADQGYDGNDDIVDEKDERKFLRSSNELNEDKIYVKTENEDSLNTKNRNSWQKISEVRLI
eukprot:g4649.t1